MYGMVSVLVVGVIGSLFMAFERNAPAWGSVSVCLMLCVVLAQLGTLYDLLDKRLPGRHSCEDDQDDEDTQIP
jgi:hypothetical protein